MALGAAIGLPRGVEPGAGFSFAHYPFRLVGSGALLVPDPDLPIDGIEARLDVAAFVPGLLFAESGARLGRGGGWYDRVLASLRPEALVVGLCLEAQIAPSLPLEAHDRAMSYVVTEDRIIDCARRGLDRTGTA
jgi:5,10-methenyltetrahydrofolate synthetase